MTRRKEATPSEVHVKPTPTPPDPTLGLHDKSWNETKWQELLIQLVDSKIINWREVTSLTLGHLNPSQVGTSLASSTGFKRKYGKGNTMRLVLGWVYAQAGKCMDCGTRLELQADHIQGREGFDDPLDADYIENMTLRCRRCNVVRRPSHVFGGTTFLTAEAALMWILLVVRPRTFKDYTRLCRLYGMTMSEIRMQEAWAMAHWLARSTPPAYGIEDEKTGRYDLLLWNDNAITRIDAGGKLPSGAKVLYPNVRGTDVLGFLEQTKGYPRAFEYPVAYVPFSTYDLGPREPQALALRYLPPIRKKKKRGPQITHLPPRNSKMLIHGLREEGQDFIFSPARHLGIKAFRLAAASTSGRLVSIKGDLSDSSLKAVPRKKKA